MKLIDADALKGPLELQRESYARIGAIERAEAYANCLWEIEQAPTVATNTNVLGKWISIKDRLPEDEGDVLVYGVSPRGRKTTAIMNYLAFDADRPHWVLDRIWTVLYWMPLPELPKEV